VKKRSIHNCCEQGELLIAATLRSTTEAIKPSGKMQMQDNASEEMPTMSGSVLGWNQLPGR
jgi:hypothetical protein